MKMHSSDHCIPPTRPRQSNYAVGITSMVAGVAAGGMGWNMFESGTSWPRHWGAKMALGGTLAGAGAGLLWFGFIASGLGQSDHTTSDWQNKMQPEGDKPHIRLR